MALSGLGVGITATGVVLAYAGFSNQPVAAAIRDILKGKSAPVRDTPGDISIAGGVAGGSNLVTAVSRYLGRPYRWGRNFDPPDGRTGGDCSGLVYRGFHDLGYLTPRLSSAAYLAWPGVTRDDTIRAGDLLWYPGHIAVAASSTTMVEAPTFGVPVRIAPIRRGALPLRPNWPLIAERYSLGAGVGVMSGG